MLRLVRVLLRSLTAALKTQRELALENLALLGESHLRRLVAEYLDGRTATPGSGLSESQRAQARSRAATTL